MSKRNKLNIVHVIAQCNDCDWHTQKHTNGRSAAYQHANGKGHVVHIEVGYAGSIRPTRINAKR